MVGFGALARSKTWPPFLRFPVMPDVNRDQVEKTCEKYPVPLPVKEFFK
jgi:hypothetical protein